MSGQQVAHPSGLLARAGTPPALLERLFNSGVEVVAGTPAELAATMKSEMAKWGKVIKEARIREE